MTVKRKALMESKKMAQERKIVLEQKKLVA